MDDSADIQQLLDQIKKLRAEKAAAVAENEKSIELPTTQEPSLIEDTDDALPEIDQTESWVEGQWDINNVMESVTTLSDGIQSGENSATPETAVNDSTAAEPLVEEVEYDVKAATPNETDLDATNSVSEAVNDVPYDQPYVCRIKNIPNGTTFMELAMLFMGLNVENIKLPDTDCSHGLVTFADRSSYLSVIANGLSLGGSTLGFVLDACDTEEETIAANSPSIDEDTASLLEIKNKIVPNDATDYVVNSQTIMDNVEAEIATEAVEVLVEWQPEYLPKAAEDATILKIERQPPINDSKVTFYPPYKCYAYNVSDHQKVAIAFGSYNVQKILAPEPGQHCFTIEFQSRNDLLQAVKKSHLLLNESGIEISLSATVLPRQRNDVTQETETIVPGSNRQLVRPIQNATQPPHFLHGPPHPSSQGRPPLPNSCVRQPQLHFQMGASHQNNQGIGPWICWPQPEYFQVRPPALNFQVGPPAPNFQVGLPISLCKPLKFNFQNESSPHHFAGPPPSYHHRAQSSVEPTRPQPGRSSGYTAKPLTDKHLVPKANDIATEPPFLCKFLNLPGNTSNDDLIKLLNRLKITKTEFPDHPENSETLRVVEFQDRVDLKTVLSTPLFIKGTVLSTKAVLHPMVSNIPQTAPVSKGSSNAIYLYNLPKDVNIAELNAPFSSFRISALNLPGPDKPYGYIEFEQPDQMQQAMQWPQLLIRNSKVVMSQIPLLSIPASTSNTGASVNATSNGHNRESRSQQPPRQRQHQQQPKASPRNRDSSTESHMTVASKNGYIKRKWHNQKKPNKPPQNFNRSIDKLESPLDAKVCIKNGMDYTDYEIRHYCRNLGKLTNSIDIRRDQQMNEIVVSVATHSEALRLCNALNSNQLGLEANVVGAIAEPSSAFFVPNDYFDKMMSGKCVRCESASQKTCAKCGRFYCNFECQRIDWPNHSTICTKIPDLVTAAEYLASVNATVSQGLLKKDATIKANAVTVAVKSTPVVTATPKVTAAPKIGATSNVGTASNVKATSNVGAALNVTYATASTNKSQPITQQTLNPAAPALAPKPTVSIEPILTVAQHQIEDPKHPPMVRAAIDVPYCVVPKPFSRVVITDVIDSRFVFVRPMDAESQKEYASNETAINEYAVTALPLAERPVPMQVVLAPCKITGKCLRALILKEMPDDLWAIAFLDHGHTALARFEEFRELSGNLQLLRRLVHKCVLNVPDRIDDKAVDRLKRLKTQCAHLIIAYTPPFTGTNPIDLQILSTGMFVKELISE